MGNREEPPEDCTRCAACCFSESDRHASVTGDDHERLGDDAERLVTWIGNAAFMRLDNGGQAAAALVAPAAPHATLGLRRCAALTVDLVLGTFACSVYERRPQVCRDLERGAAACRGELAAKASRPPRALLVLRSLTSRARTSR